MKKYRVGIIGIGNIAYVHIDALKKLSNVEIVSISSRNNIEEKSKRLNIQSCYTDYKDMIDKEILDSVHICTSNDVHYEIASYALKKGVHVILEKPMTMDVKSAAKLVKLAQTTSLVAKIHFHNRFYAINQHIKNHMDDVGQIISIHGEYTQGWAANPKVYNWRDNQKYGGLTSVIGDIGSHYFDTIEFLSGHKVIEVSAKFKQVHQQRGGILVDTEDLGVIIYKTNKGAIGSTIISQSLIGHDNKLAFTISGLKGSFLSDGLDATKAYFAKMDKPFQEITSTHIETLKTAAKFLSTNFIEAFSEAFKQFYFEIDNRNFKSDYANFEDGLHSMKLIEAIYKSNKYNKWIKVK